MTPDVVVAVDGGGTKTDVVVADVTGAVLARHQGPGCSQHALGRDRAAAVVDETVRAALAAAGVPASSVRTAHCYLTAVDLPEESAALRRELLRCDWAGDLVLDNDVFALLRAGTDAPDAVVVVCGTGINAAGVRADGRHERFLSLGRVSGDWGGGSGLAEEVVWAAARAEDGRGPDTALRAAVLRRSGAASIAEVSVSLHAGVRDWGSLHDLARDVVRLAAEGDPVAGALVERQAEEVAAMGAALIRRLGLQGRRVPVVLGGGVLTSGDARLLDGVARRLALLAPSAAPVVVQDPPVLGAVLLALGADAAAAADVRTAFRGLAAAACGAD